ncbi:hypothetical protein Cob_v010046 [Colletotrichum orbiculare MAFF 240422]|uniref:Uncharacterized protein n=1 Tax=Colletotrichum orbiculare (strain 104-T / ATCC 96160 / CBS 514.97 / LARS 414 / MAFF 240422) TaxID=1213857 RepID=A0A484FJC8_COLOR|nr:hypothetical protein Cob_v010046 [Colletotrichum orbiculare MAFF 240422]
MFFLSASSFFALYAVRHRRNTTRAEIIFKLKTNRKVSSSAEKRRDRRWRRSLERRSNNTLASSGSHLCTWPMPRPLPPDAEWPLPHARDEASPTGLILASGCHSSCTPVHLHSHSTGLIAS